MWFKTIALLEDIYFHIWCEHCFDSPYNYNSESSLADLPNLAIRVVRVHRRNDLNIYRNNLKNLSLKLDIQTQNKYVYQFGIRIGSSTRRSFSVRAFPAKRSKNNFDDSCKPEKNMRGKSACKSKAHAEGKNEKLTLAPPMHPPPPPPWTKIHITFWLSQQIGIQHQRFAYHGRFKGLWNNPSRFYCLLRRIIFQFPFPYYFLSMIFISKSPFNCIVLWEVTI